MKTVCLDTSFLIALYDDRDQYHGPATRHFVKYLDRTRNSLLSPWPIVYETLRTRLVRNQQRLRRFRRDWLRFQREGRLTLLDDLPFRDEALNDCLAEADRIRGTYRTLSLVDRVIRALLADTGLKIDYFFTFNERDFADVCRKYRRILITGAATAE